MRTLLQFLFLMLALDVHAAAGGHVKGFRGLKIGSDVTPFSPTNFDNLFGWWKADAITNTVNGSSVSNWIDSSGHNLTMTAIAGTGPYWTNSFQGGMPAAYFNGTSDYMTNACSTPTNNMLFIVVAQATTAIVPAQLLSSRSLDGGAQPNATLIYGASGQITNSLQLTTGQSITVTNAAPTNTTPWTYVFSTSGIATNCGAWTNGVSCTGTNGSIGAYTFDGIVVGAKSDTLDKFFKGRLLEMFFITNVNAELIHIYQQNGAGYLRTKYAHY